jgi:hypothetical protein
MTTPPSSTPPWLSDSVLSLISLAYQAGRYDERRAAQPAVARGVASVSHNRGRVRTDLSKLLLRAELHKIIPTARQYSDGRPAYTADTARFAELPR